jgi:hypothetical protein
MTESEAQGRKHGDTVEYQGESATIVAIYLHPRDGRDAFRASFHVRTTLGADYHDVDYRLLQLCPPA